MKYLKITSISLLLFFLYTIYAFYLRQGHIVNVYEHTEYIDNFKKDCRFTVVLVENVPLSRYAQKRMWAKYSDSLLAPPTLSHICDDILFLDNITERADDIGDNNYWMGENQYCLNGIFGKDKCISKEHQLFTVGMINWSNDEKVGEIDKKPIYIHFINYGS